jgi:hypothetical protein
MPRGGRRPGAGAPAGNLNAYKHGKTSRQHARLAEIIASDPEALALAREILSGETHRQARRVEQAKRLLDTLFAKAQAHAADRAAQDYERRRAIPPPPGVDPYQQ